MREKFKDLVTKICHFLITDVIITGLPAVCHDVTSGMGSGALVEPKP